MTVMMPIKVLRHIASRAATGKSRTVKIRHIMANDVARAYFNAPSTSPVFLELCEEDRKLGDKGTRGELSVSMYGTRSAARNWQKCVTDQLYNCGFRVTRGNTCMFRHQERDIVVMVHRDDFVSTADIEDLRWLENMLKEKLEIQRDIIGHEEDSKKHIKELNRFICQRWWIHVRVRCHKFGA